LRHGRERRLIASAEDATADAVRTVVEVLDLAIGVRVRLAHEALAEQGDAKFGECGHYQFGGRSSGFGVWFMVRCSKSGSWFDVRRTCFSSDGDWVRAER